MHALRYHDLDLTEETFLDCRQVVNAGSSSLKYALYSVERPMGVPLPDDVPTTTACLQSSPVRAVQLASGSIAEIGGQSVVTHKRVGKEIETLSFVASMPNFGAAFSEMIRYLTDPARGLVQV